MKPSPFASIRPFLPVHASTVPAAYRALNEYLKNRYADTVVLAFAQIESLIEDQLPTAAYSLEWWTMAPQDDIQSAHSRAWTDADRTAAPNLTAQNVVFERARISVASSAGRS